MSLNRDHESQNESHQNSEIDSEEEDDTSDMTDEESEDEETQQDKEESGEVLHQSQELQLPDPQQRPPMPVIRQLIPKSNLQESAASFVRRDGNKTEIQDRMPARKVNSKQNRDWATRSGRGNPFGAHFERSFGNYPEETSYGFSSLPYEGPYNPNGGNFQALCPEKLIDVLLDTSNCQASLLLLVERYNFHPAHVRRLISDFQHIFSMEDERVLLQPQVAICNDHLGTSGCRNRLNCHGIHICQNFIKGVCDESGCLFGHKFNTNHNSRILHNFHISHLSMSRLKKLLKANLPDAETQGPLEICQDYNKGNCMKRNCDSLHICSDFIAGKLKCRILQCKLNHNLLSSDCRWLLDRQGIDTNEAPRDILTLLLEVNPAIGNFSPTSDVASEVDASDQTATNRNTHKFTSITDTSNTQINDGAPVMQSAAATNASNPNADNLENVTIDSDLEENTVQTINSLTSASLPVVQTSESTLRTSTLESETATNIHESKSRATDPSRVRPPVNIENSRSLWSHHLEGDVRVAEICYDSVENVCPDESKGCPKLHSTRHFHWQVSEESYTWLNLQPAQVLSLERSFCNPGIDETTLPALHKEHLDPAMQILLLLMGEEVWQANFQGMILVDSDNSRILYLRRISTEIIPGLPIEQSTYHWFYCNSNGIWVEYGDTTASEEEQSDYVNSEAIESQYMINPNSYAQFTMSGIEYILDFNSMTQTNTSNEEVQLVRRRPKPHLPLAEEDNDNLTSSNQGSSSQLSGTIIDISTEEESSD